jgi:hydrogenase nickel incorporation protein HypB
MKIVAAKKILKANDQLAEENRRSYQSAGVFCLNLVGSPGCGKTTLLEGLFQQLGESASAAVIEGDIAGQVDAERMTEIGIPVVQINTDGMCHLDANMVAAASEDLDLSALDMLLIENVGNLVCTSGFDLGEHLRIVALSVPEGDDKIVKYPGIFRRSDALVITKIDTLPHFDFDVQRVRNDMQRLAPEAVVFEVSALRGTGMAEFAAWIQQRQKSV